MRHDLNASTKPRPGEMNWKEWLTTEAIKLGLQDMTLYRRIKAGTYPMPPVRKLNKRVIFVKLPH
jgi:hypothetical protein